MPNPTNPPPSLAVESLQQQVAEIAELHRLATQPGSAIITGADYLAYDAARIELPKRLPFLLDVALAALAVLGEPVAPCCPQCGGPIGRADDPISPDGWDTVNALEWFCWQSPTSCGEWRGSTDEALIAGSRRALTTRLGVARGE